MHAVIKRVTKSAYESLAGQRATCNNDPCPVIRIPRVSYPDSLGLSQLWQFHTTNILAPTRTGSYARSRWPMPDHCEKALCAGTSNLRLHGSRTPQCALRALLRHINAISLMRPHSVLYHVPDRFYPAMVQTAQALLSIVLCHNLQPFPEHLLRPTTGGASVAGPDKDQSALVKWVKDKDQTALVKMVKDAEGYASTITPSLPCR